MAEGLTVRREMNEEYTVSPFCLCTSNEQMFKVKKLHLS